MGFLRRRRRSHTSPVALPPGAAPAVFTKVAVIQDSIRELYRGLSADTVRSFTANIAPVFAELPSGVDPVIGAQRMAKAMATHLRMTEVRLIVSFQELGRADGDGFHAGNVGLGSGPEYFITLSPRYRTDVRDMAAVLAHEVMHVFLHRNRIAFADTDRNEILTDTAAVYLGTGWLMLNGFRVSTTQDGNVRRTHRQTLGYVSPEEHGYVLAKRALAFDEDIETYLSGNVQARHAYHAGRRRARQDYEVAPLAGCDAVSRRQYRKDLRYAEEVATATGVSGLVLPFTGGYRFEGRDPMKVVFGCPACHQLTRVPVGRTITIRCGVCRSTHACET